MLSNRTAAAAATAAPTVLHPYARATSGVEVRARAIYYGIDVSSFQWFFGAVRRCGGVVVVMEDVVRHAARWQRRQRWLRPCAVCSGFRGASAACEAHAEASLLFRSAVRVCMCVCVHARGWALK